MTLGETLKKLESFGSAGVRAIYKKHGAGDNQFGVKFGDLKKLVKQIKTDHALARELWKTGNSDARMLATFVADPGAMSLAELESWANDIAYYALADGFVANVASKSPHRREAMLRWIESPKEFVAQAGWQLLSGLAQSGAAEPDSFFAAFLKRIEREIHSERNRVRHAMNGALIGIGVRNEALREKALAAAARIGRVDVDHGETACKTPDAAEYIAKVLAHRNKSSRLKPAAAR